MNKSAWCIKCKTKKKKKRYKSSNILRRHLLDYKYFWRHKAKKVLILMYSSLISQQSLKVNVCSKTIQNIICSYTSRNQNYILVSEVSWLVFSRYLMFAKFKYIICHKFRNLNLQENILTIVTHKSSSSWSKKLVHHLDSRE